MDTHTVSTVKALELQSLLSNVKNGAVKKDAFYSIKANGDHLLVDPVNGEPFVFVAPRTVHVFPVKKGSGTDKLRQRIAADYFFDRLAA